MFSFLFETIRKGFGQGGKQAPETAFDGRQGILSCRNHR